MFWVVAPVWAGQLGMHCDQGIESTFRICERHLTDWPLVIPHVATIRATCEGSERTAVASAQALTGKQLRNFAERQASQTQRASLGDHSLLSFHLDERHAIGIERVTLRSDAPGELTEAGLVLHRCGRPLASRSHWPTEDGFDARDRRRSRGGSRLQGWSLHFCGHQ